MIGTWLSGLLSSRLSLRIAAGMSAVFVLSIAVLAGLSGLATRDVLIKAAIDRDTVEASELGRTAGRLVATGGLANLQSVIDDRVRAGGYHTIRIYDQTGAMRFVAGNNVSTVFETPFSELSTDAEAPKWRVDAGALSVVAPVSSNGRVLGWIETVRRSDSTMNAAYAAFQHYQMGWIALASFAVLLILVMSEGLTAGLRRIARYVEAASDSGSAGRPPVPGPDEAGRIGRAAARMATELAALSRENARLRHRDPVTGLMNGDGFADACRTALLGGHDTVAALMAIDISRFRALIETLGRNGAECLVAVLADRLRDQLNGGVGTSSSAAPLLARAGDGTFLLLLPGFGRATAVAALADRLLKACKRPVRVDGRDIVATIDIGAAMAPTNGTDYDSLVAAARMAASAAAANGIGQYRFFTAAMSDLADQRLGLENDLRTALGDGALSLRYQPQLDCRTGRICGVETLVRWHHPEHGPIGPDRFIPIAEETGLIVEMGWWIMRQACRQSAHWTAQGNTLRVAINVSVRQFEERDFVPRLLGILNETGADPARIELEITESLAARDTEQLIRVLQSLRDRGFRVAIDDFGTGYSNLSILSRLPIDVFKIDRSLVANLEADKDAQLVLGTMLTLAHHLRCEVVAEGIETQGQFEFLKKAGCDVVQGYFIAPPLVADAIEAVTIGARQMRPEAAQAELGQARLTA